MGTDCPETAVDIRKGEARYGIEVDQVPCLKGTYVISELERPGAFALRRRGRVPGLVAQVRRVTNPPRVESQKAVFAGRRDVLRVGFMIMYTHYSPCELLFVAGVSLSSFFAVRPL